MANVQYTYGRYVNKIRAVANALPQAVDDILREVIEDEALPVAKQLCPVLSGRLKKSIRAVHVRLLLWKLMAGNMEVDGVFVDYERWVEGGRHNMMAQPFMAPAMQSGVKSLLRKFAQLERYVARYVR